MKKLNDLLLLSSGWSLVGPGFIDGIWANTTHSAGSYGFLLDNYLGLAGSLMGSFFGNMLKITTADLQALMIMEIS